MEWRERIQAACRRGRFTRKDHGLAGKYTLESTWSPYAHCAVGEQADHYGAELFFSNPISRCGVMDKDMSNKGSDFLSAVISNNFTKAERLLEEIEDRAIQIKRGLPSENL